MRRKRGVNMTAEAQTTAKTKAKKRFYKRWWFWLAAVIVLAIAFSPKGSTNQSASQGTDTSSSDNTTADAQSKTSEPAIPVEYRSALSKATLYSNMQHMSKQGLYDQLTSEYGEKFTAEAAQYAIDNVKADWNANALAKAKSYQSQQSMSPAAIRDQLVSTYGEKFTESEADYADQHLND
jgi:hypothetical protein